MKLQRPIFNRDSRANRLKAYELRRPRDVESAVRWLDLRGPEEVAWQVELAFAGLARRVEVPDHRRNTWNHRLEMRRGVPDGLQEMLDLLTEVLTLTSTPHVDAAIALDWYKVPPDEGQDWTNTETGELVYHAKYFRFSPRRQATARTELIERMASIVERHPLYAPISYIVSVPGSKADGKSFGERLAAEVARRTDKTLIKATSTLGPRPPAKEGSTTAQVGDFHIPLTLRGPVIIIDDVYRSGNSMRAASYAARQAGAAKVFGLVPVRTMRN